MLILRGGLYSGLNLDPDLSSRSLLLILLRESYEVTSRASTKQTQPQFGAEEKGAIELRCVSGYQQAGAASSSEIEPLHAFASDCFTSWVMIFARGLVAVLRALATQSDVMRIFYS